MKYTILTILFIWSAITSWAQSGQCLPGGCNTGIAFGANQTTVTNSFVNSLAGTFAGECNTYNVTSGQQYEWSLCTSDGAVNPTSDMTLTLTDNVSNTILCFSDNVCGLQPKILWTATLTGVVRVYLHTPNCGTDSVSHTVRWRCADCAAPEVPSNDLICNATPIDCGQTVAGTTVNATLSGTGEGAACGGTATQPGVWYSVAGNGQIMKASLCSTVWDSRIQVFSGVNCGEIACVGGNDDGGPACSGTSASFQWTSVAGLNYYIFVSGFFTSSAFNLGLTCADPPTPPVNDIICNARPILCGEVQTGTTANATMVGTGEALTCSGVIQNQPGVWYSTVGNGNVFRASLCGSSWDSRIQVFTGSSCNSVSCVTANDNNGPMCAGSAASVAWATVNGATYYILISGAIISSEFSLSLSCQELCNPACTSGLPPSNDNCFDATDLGMLPQPAACPSGVGTILSIDGSNLCATASANSSGLLGCQPSGNQPLQMADVWYKFTITGPILNVTIVGLNTPNFAIYEGSNCINLVPRGCAIGSGGFLNQQFLGLAPGTYFLQIGGANLQDQCNFNLTLQNNFDCAGCLLASDLAVSPPPVNGQYQPGTLVTFCYSVLNYQQTSANWLHGVIPTFGSGWDLSTFVPLATNVTGGASVSNCTSGGTWSWYNSNITGTAYGLVFGPGFYFETASGGPPIDGNPGNNFGDANAANCQWTFCWQIRTKDATQCSSNPNLSVSINTTGDAESGSWSNLACTQDPNTNFYAQANCCPAPTINTNNISCADTFGGATAQANGQGPWEYYWLNSIGDTLLVASETFAESSIENLEEGDYILQVVDSTGCTSFTYFSISVDVSDAFGMSCDDNDPCTVNDVILADCTCAGTFADADNDGICNANDNCAGPEAGSACDDNDPCTVNDVILADCACAGTFADADNDGTCNANDNCAGPEAGSACDDNDPCTVNDVILSDCSCAGTFADADNDGICNANDNCAGPEAGSACDDNDPCTVADVILADCSCAGTFADADNDGICNANDNCAGPEAGSACDDNNPCTVNDVILADCTCAGNFADADNDGICNANDNCAGPEAGSACDDNDPCTVNDVILADCTCAGTFADADNDGICNADDNCAGPEAGSACDDNDPCTVNDVILADCSCAGTFADADNDGICNADDNCAGPEEGSACDDNDPCTVNDVILADCSCAGTFADADNDGICNANDNCAGPEAGSACDDNDPCTTGDIILDDCSCAGTFADADNDGICNANDNCAGPEAGSACDDNDPCTVNDVILADCSCAGTFADADNDGICNANDNCAGPEAGSACDDNDPCTVNDVILADCSCAGTFADADNDGICNANDNCAGPEAGSACDDNDPCTADDVISADCVCVGAPVAIGTSTTEVTACDSYSWNGSTYTNSGAYDFATTNANGCDSIATLILTIQQPSIAPISVSTSVTSVIIGGNVTLSVVGGILGSGAEWIWYTGSCGGTQIGSGASIVVSINISTTYYVRAEGACNNTSCASATVQVFLPCGPQNILTSASTICAGATATLNVQGAITSGATWRWYIGNCGGTLIGTGASITVSPATTTTYFVRAEGGNCGTTLCLSTTVTVNIPPSIPQGIILPIVVCRNSPITISVLNPVVGLSYFWDLPNGWTITSGQGTSTIQAFTGQSNGQIRVYASNECGISKRYLRSVSPLNCNRSSDYSIEPLRIELWPNPSSDIVHFAHGEMTPERMVIYDTMGRVIYDGNWMNEMDVSTLAGGIYFVRATSNGESVVIRMEVAR